MKLRRSMALLILTSLALVACGAAETLAPQVALREAAQTTLGQEHAQYTLSLVGSEDDVNALVNGGKALTDDDRKGLELLRTSRLVVSTGAGRFAADLRLGTLDRAFELRGLESKLYVRADVAGMAKLFGAEPGELDDVVTQAREAGFDFVADAVAGRWLWLDLNALAKFGEEFAEKNGLPVPEGITGAEGLKGLEGFTQLRDAIAAAWSENVKVERLSREGAGDHYQLTVPLRQVYQRLAPALSGLPGLPGLPAGPGLPSADLVPDRNVIADVWVADGRLTRAELDLAQFAQKVGAAEGGRVALRIDVADRASDVSAPTGAVEVKLAEILQRFLGAFAGLSGAGISS